jgi:hypothetical protein
MEFLAKVSEMCMLPAPSGCQNIYLPVQQGGCVDIVFPLGVGVDIATFESTSKCQICLQYQYF